MFQLRPVFLITGLLVIALGVTMLVPMCASMSGTGPLYERDWNGFATGTLICILTGGTALAIGRGPVHSISVRQGFLLTGASWIVLVVMAAVPLMLGGLDLSFTDAFFEAMSGMTTTGSTVITTLDTAPPGALLWRSMLQWFGGVGFIIMAFSVFPALRIGGMQVFRSEAWDTSERFFTGAAQYSVALSLIYVFFTAACFFALWIAGMPPWHAVNHAMTTVATGGFSTRDASLGAFMDAGHAPLDMVVTVFMIIGSLPFGIFLAVCVQGHVRRLYTDSQIRFFMAIVAGTTILMTLRLMDIFDTGLYPAFRLALFNVVSVITGTGFSTADYNGWGPLAHGIFFCIMFIGGCAGSTSCGMKIFRFQVVLAAMAVYARRLAHPHRVFVASYNARPLTDDILLSVLSFFFVYFASFATLAVILSGLGLDTVTALSAAGTAIANVGPGLGETVGPSGTFAALPDSAKLAISAGMLLGRLEFFTLLVLFSPVFWRT